MAWLLRIICKNCLEEHILVTEKQEVPNTEDSLEYTCPEDMSQRCFYNQGKDKYTWEKAISLKISKQKI